MNIEEFRKAEFRRLGEWFMQLPETAKIDMYNAYWLPNDCKTPTCFGGWLARYYGCGATIDGYVSYTAGISAIETKLNGRFDDIRLNSELWGNEYGRFVFTDARAFNEGGEEYTNSSITIKAIGKKLLAVYRRLKK